MRLLATKILDLPFKTRILALGYRLVEYSFIEKTAINHPTKAWSENWIFSSAYAAKIALEHSKIGAALKGKRLFCVGKKTAAVFLAQSLDVVQIAPNAMALTEKIRATEPPTAFSFFCGKKRRPEIETHLTAAGISIDIHELYTTTLNPKSFPSSFDGALFFSPSAVESFVQSNPIETLHAFCIGPTTATAVAKYSDNYSIAQNPDEGSLLVQLKKYSATHAEK